MDSLLFFQKRKTPPRWLMHLLLSLLLLGVASAKRNNAHTPMQPTEHAAKAPDYVVTSGYYMAKQHKPGSNSSKCLVGSLTDGPSWMSCDSSAGSVCKWGSTFYGAEFYYKMATVNGVDMLAEVNYQSGVVNKIMGQDGCEYTLACVEMKGTWATTPDCHMPLDLHSFYFEQTKCEFKIPSLGVFGTVHGTQAISLDENGESVKSFRAHVKSVGKRMVQMTLHHPKYDAACIFTKQPNVGPITGHANPAGRRLLCECDPLPGCSGGFLHRCGECCIDDIMCSSCRGNALGCSGCS